MKALTQSDIRTANIAANTRPKKPMIEVLKSEREKLETRYEAERSLLDRLIARLEPTTVQPTEAGTPDKPPLKLSPLVAALRHPAVAPMIAASSRPLNARTEPGDPATDTVSAAVRSYIAKHPEFRVADIVSELGCSAPGAHCAVAKLAKSGALERIGYGRYRRTPAFHPAAQPGDE